MLGVKFNPSEKEEIVRRYKLDGCKVFDVAYLCPSDERKKVLPNNLYETIDLCIQTNSEFETGGECTLADLLALLSAFSTDLLPLKFYPVDLESLVGDFARVACTYGQVESPGLDGFYVPMTLAHYVRFLGLVQRLFKLYGKIFRPPPGLGGFIVSMTHLYNGIDSAGAARRSDMLVPIRLVRPCAYTDTLLLRSGIAWFGHPVKQDVLAGASAKAIDGWSLKAAEVTSGRSAPESLVVSTVRLASAEVTNVELIETVEFAVRGLFHPQLVHDTQVKSTYLQSNSIEQFHEAQQSAKGILFPDVVEGSAIGYANMIKGAGLEGAATDLVVASLGRMPGGLYHEKGLLGYPSVFLSTEKSETSNIVLTVPTELKTALSSFAGDPLPLYDIVFCNGRVGDDVFQATAFDAPRSYDINATIQLAHALRHIRDGGTIAVRFAGRLVDQPVLYELVYSVLSWFALFMIYRVELYAGHTMGYLVLKSYQHPLCHMSLLGRVNFEMVLATHDYQVLGFLHGLYLAASYKASVRVSPEFALVQELAKTPHRFKWRNSWIRFVKHIDRLQYTVSQARMLKQAYDPHLSRARGATIPAVADVPYRYWHVGRQMLLDSYQGKLKLFCIPRHKIHQVARAVSVASAEDFWLYYVGETRVQYWKAKHRPNERQVRIIWSILRGSSAPQCAQHILNVSKLLMSEERLDWFLSTFLEPQPGSGVPLWSLNYRIVSGMTSPFVSRNRGAGLDDYDTDLSVLPQPEGEVIKGFDPRQFLQYNIGGTQIGELPYRSVPKAFEPHETELIQRALGFMPARFTIEQVAGYIYAHWKVEIKLSELSYFLQTSGLIKQSAGGHFMRAS